MNSWSGLQGILDLDTPIQMTLNKTEGVTQDNIIMSLRDMLMSFDVLRMQKPVCIMIVKMAGGSHECIYSYLTRAERD